jgi:uncharacterized RDD family membrane protein YckC
MLEGSKGTRLSNGGTPPGWYPDPGGAGLRYFDGNAWTGNIAPPAAPVGGYGPQLATGQPWKGARYGRPQSGPGSLADPGRRLCARLLDALVFTPVVIAVIAIAIAVFAPHYGPLFPNESSDPNSTGPTPGFFWLYLTVFGAAAFSWVAFFFYEAIATVRYGRTLGKRWMEIRPVTYDGRPLGTGPSFGRAAVHSLAGCLGWLGFIDDLWCLWDPDAQCLHDKAASTLVVND